MEKKQVVIEIDADATGAEQAFTNIKTELKAANLELIKMQSQFGDYSEQAVKAAKKVAELRDKIQDAKETADLFDPGKKLQAVIGAAGSVAAGFSVATSAMALFGEESAELEKTLIKVNAAMAMASGLQQLADSAKDFQRLGAMAKQAFQVIKAGIGSLGIGLFVIALGTIVANWDAIRKAMIETFPILEDTGKMFNTLKQVFFGVGQALISYLITPFKTFFKLIQGDFKGALNEVLNGFNVIKNYEKGASAERQKQAEQASKERLELWIKEAEDQLAIQKALGKATYDEELKILNAKKQLNLNNVEELKKINQQIKILQATKSIEDRKRHEEELKRQEELTKKRKEQFLEFSGFRSELNELSKQISESIDEIFNPKQTLTGGLSERTNSALSELKKFEVELTKMKDRRDKILTDLQTVAPEDKQLLKDELIELDDMLKDGYRNLSNLSDNFITMHNIEFKNRKESITNIKEYDKAFESLSMTMSDMAFIVSENNILATEKQKEGVSEIRKKEIEEQIKNNNIQISIYKNFIDQIKKEDIKRYEDTKLINKLIYDAELLEQQGFHSESLKLRKKAFEKQTEFENNDLSTKSTNALAILEDLNKKVAEFNKDERTIDEYIKLTSQQLDAQKIANETELAYRTKLNNDNLQLKRFDNDIQLALTRERLDAEFMLEEEAFNRKMALHQSFADFASNLNDESLIKNKEIRLGLLAIEKGLAISQVVMGANRAISQARFNLSQVPAVIGAAPNPMYPVQAASTAKNILTTKITSGLAIANILATGLKGAKSIMGSGSSGGSDISGGATVIQGGSGGTVAPQFNIVGSSNTNQLAEAIAKAQGKPVRSYVVGSDVTTQQSLDRNRINNSTFL